MSKPHIIFKRGEALIFSSRRSSLDCMPQFIFDSIPEAIIFLKQIKRIKDI